MGKKVYDKCALCLQERELRKSHFMPSGFYKAIKGKKNDDIVNNLKNHNEVGYGDRQLTAHLLCDDCEDKFNKNGEKIAIKECYQYHYDKFELLDKANFV